MASQKHLSVSHSSFVRSFVHSHIVAHIDFSRFRKDVNICLFQTVNDNVGFLQLRISQGGYSMLCPFYKAIRMTGPRDLACYISNEYYDRAYTLNASTFLYKNFYRVDITYQKSLKK